MTDNGFLYFFGTRGYALGENILVFELEKIKWYARRDSNPRPSAPEADALSS